MTWNLMLQSFRVLADHKKLAIFPVLSAVAAAVVALPFLGLLQTQHFSWPVLIAGYIAVNFVMIFFNSALAYCANATFAGAEPSLADGLRRAAARVPSIFAWSVVAGTVGLFLKWLQDRTGWAGKIALWLTGFAWDMATFLIVPVLVIEEGGVMDSLRRSGELFRNTWGSQLISMAAFLWVGVLATLLGILLAVLAGALVGPIAAMAICVPYFAAMFASLTAAHEIFTVGLYRQATSR